MAHGVRALAVTLRTYQRAHGCKTVADFIGRWAPPNENNTAAYVKAVSASLGGILTPTVWSGATYLYTDHAADLRALCLAISSHENGIGWRELIANPTFAAALASGVQMAIPLETAHA